VRAHGLECIPRAAFARGPFVLQGRWKGENEIALGRHEVYSHVAKSQRFSIAEPYGREVIPARPIRVDELPEPLRTSTR